MIVCQEPTRYRVMVLTSPGPQLECGALHDLRTRFPEGQSSRRYQRDEKRRHTGQQGPGYEGYQQTGSKTCACSQLVNVGRKCESKTTEGGRKRSVPGRDARRAVQAKVLVTYVPGESDPACEEGQSVPGFGPDTRRSRTSEGAKGCCDNKVHHT